MSVCDTQAQLALSDIALHACLVLNHISMRFMGYNIHKCYTQELVSHVASRVLKLKATKIIKVMIRVCHFPYKWTQDRSEGRERLLSAINDTSLAFAFN